MPSISDVAKEKYKSLQSVDGIIDAFAKQDMDIELFEKARELRFKIKNEDEYNNE